MEAAEGAELTTALPNPKACPPRVARPPPLWGILLGPSVKAQTAGEEVADVAGAEEDVVASTTITITRFFKEDCPNKSHNKANLEGPLVLPVEPSGEEEDVEEEEGEDNEEEEQGEHEEEEEEEEHEGPPEEPEETPEADGDGHESEPDPEVEVPNVDDDGDEEMANA